jgi:predicted Abi (CAAX) family protease
MDTITINQQADDAFDHAIDTGRLSTDKSAPNYAGHYMYMGNGKNGAMFKNIVTRQYI